MTIQTLVNEAVTRKDEYVVRHWTASKLGSCLTGVYLERMGAKRDEEFTERELRVFACGRFFEEWLVAQIAKKTSDYQTQVRVEWPEYDFTGYADLAISELVYEVKSKNSNAFTYMTGNSRRQGEGPNKQHVMQLWSYLKVLNKQEGRLIYLSKDDLRIAEYPVLLNNPQVEADVMRELEILNRAWKEKLPPPVMYGEKDWQSKYCGFHKQCVRQEKYLNLN